MFKKTIKKVSHLVVVGYDEIVSNKYTECFEKVFNEGLITGYTVIDLLSEKESIEKRIKELQFKPSEIIYLDNIRKSEDEWFSEDYFGPIFSMLKIKWGNIKVYIATEVKSHEKYLKYCSIQDYSTLVEKPIFAPMTNNVFDVDKIPFVMEELNNYIAKCKNNFSVMTLSRYHAIYNDVVIKFLKDKIKELETPITSIHLRHAGGVWNTHKEYDERDDHPYKYGYGMLMHGGYHYVDLVAQCVYLNKLLYPNKKFSLEMSSFAAYPQDQNARIGEKVSRQFEDYKESFYKEKKDVRYGETDITSTFCIREQATGRVVTLGTISLEQTTPSVRTWKDIPEGIYNKNGRTSSVELEVQMSTVHSIKVHCYDVPVKGEKEVERIDAFARVTTRSNASMYRNEEYVTDNTFSGLFHSNSNKKLMLAWLRDEDEVSKFQNHSVVMKFIYAIGKSIDTPGKSICVDLM